MLVKILMYWRVSGVDTKQCSVCKIYLILKTYVKEIDKIIESKH